MAFKHNELYYFVPEADKFGGNRTLTQDGYDYLKGLFAEKLITVSKLPKFDI
jgi:hypothetical protein